VSSKKHAAKKPAAAGRGKIVGTATSASILGGPVGAVKAPNRARPTDPEWDRYRQILLDLREQLVRQMNGLAKESAEQLPGYSMHMADSGTDNFDRDFALSLVSSEQEALSEIEAAIQRIRTGTYGICEITQKPIAKERLLAVPFTRYSAEAQKEIERNRYRTRTGAGLFGEIGEEGASLSGGGDDGGDE